MGAGSAPLTLIALSAALIVGGSASSRIPLLQHDQHAPSRIGKVPATKAESDPGYRLPGDVVPLEYTLILKPRLSDPDPAKAFTFEGTLELKFDMTREQVDTLVMHTRDLHLSTTTPIEITPDKPKIVVDYDEKYEFLKLELDRPLRLNVTYTMSIKYDGAIRSDMTGFYRSSYKEGNVTKWLATTQLEQSHARKVFPCFDEPGYKAVFRLTMDCPAGMKCVANMKPKTGGTGNSVNYYESPPMPTYLLAFLVSEFESESSTVNPEFSVWHRPEARGQARFALTHGVNVVTSLEEYTGISYYNMHPQSANIKMKMDQVAVPDFSAGAMENWGLITYKEGSLLIHEDVSTTRSKRGVVGILAHEIAHMWFGDLVTCKWWSETWLNEGFATFFANYAANKVAPGFHHADQFVTDEVHPALSADDGEDAIPLTNYNVNDPKEVKDSFGTITYKKGASVIRMMEHWIGPATFKKGINYYLTNMTYKAAVPHDLFRALQLAADEDKSIEGYEYNVSSVFESWTLYAGHPVLHVSVDHKDKMIVLKQQRYLNTDSTEHNRTYLIPITFASSKNASFDNTKPVTIMSEEMMKLDAGVHDNWVILNVQQTGFYRVLYSDEMYGFIIKAFANDDNRKAVHINNRAQLIDDAMTFAIDEKLKFATMFDLIQFLENELDYTPWTAAFSGIAKMRMKFMHFESLSSDFEMHIANLMKKVVDDLSLNIGNDDDERRRIFRTDVMKMACDLGHEHCVNKSVEWFANWVEDKTFVIPPDHREFVYCNGLRHGETSYFDELWAKYLDENVVNEKNVILGALGCTKDAEKLMRFLNYSLGKNIRDHDKLNAFNSALRGNKENADTVLTYVVHHPNRFRKSYGAANFKTALTTMPNYMSNDTLADYKLFLDINNGTLTDDEVKAATDSIQMKEATLEWVMSHEKEIANWISAKYNSAAALASSLVLMVAMLCVLFAR